MGEIVNLRARRKAANRAKHEAEAAENRVRFGRTKAEKKVSAGEAAIEERRFEGHRIEETSDGASSPEEKR